MPVYEVQGPDGRIFEVEGPRPPSATDLKRVFSRLPKAAAPIPRHAQPGIGARDLGLEFDQEEVDAAESTGATALGLYGGAAMGGPAVAGAALRAAGPVMKAAANPYVAGGLAGAHELLRGGSLKDAATQAVITGAGGKYLGHAVSAIAGRMPKSLVARLAHQVARAAKTAPVKEVAPAGRAYQGIPSLMKVGGEAAETGAAAAQKGAQGAASIAKAAPRKLAPIPSVPDVAKAAKTTGRVTRAVEKVAETVDEVPETAIQTRLRASILMKENPRALTDEIAEKVITIKSGVGQGLSRPQMTATIEEMYGFPRSNAKAMVDLIFEHQGWK